MLTTHQLTLIAWPHQTQFPVGTVGTWEPVAGFT